LKGRLLWSIDSNFFHQSEDLPGVAEES